MTEFVPADDSTLAPALAGLPDGALVVVDFDGTLLLRNSTQLYLRTLRPRFIAAPLLSMMELVQPWRVLPGADKRFVYRDWVRVVVMSILLPWSALLWRRRVPGIAHAYTNTGLRQVLTDSGRARVMVATYGFRFIVAPLLRAMDCPWELGVSANFLGAFRLRRTGKAEAVRARVGAVALAGSVLITDSVDDRDFLPHSRQAFLITPDEDAHTVTPSTGYLPLQYMQNCKRKGENTIVRVILFYDLVCLFLAYATASVAPLYTAAGLVFFQLSFWTIYEMGNWENDVLGDIYEDKPHIPEAFARWRSRVKPVQAWIWATLLMVPCAVLLALGGATAGWGLPESSAIIVLFAGLLVYLLLSRASYALYNRTDPKTRVFLYPLMQLSKGVGLAALLPAAPAGLMLLLAIMLVRQLRYVVYRYAETRNAFNIPVNLHTLALFVLLAAVSLCLTGPATPMFWTISIIAVLWHLQRARRDITGFVRGIVWLPAKVRTRV